MKKTLFNLQLFADETAAAETGSDPETTTEQTKEQATEQKQESKAQKKEGEKVFTHDDFNRLFNQKYAELEQKKQKEIDEAKKLAEMNAEEKANYKAQQEKERADKVQKELDEYKRKDALNEMSKTARKMLADENINIPDELLSRLVTTDASETKTAVDSFAKLYKEAVENGVKERLRGDVPTASTGSATISEIDKRIKKYE
ncbi:MAG: DUF4355 domain-containing protein [Clostridia bacterium]|nr:DUF4355 domain-containing protein [Clostridia bacterium]